MDDVRRYIENQESHHANRYYQEEFRLLCAKHGIEILHFTDGSTKTVQYTPDMSILGDAAFSSTGNNQSETYGNETGRFVGLADDTRLMDYAVFVVEDDHLNDDGDSE